MNELREISLRTGKARDKQPIYNTEPGAQQMKTFS